MADDRTTLLVQFRQSSEEGPGDIVGAFANEANVDPDAIGAIDIDDGRATVDVRAGVADRVVQMLDGSRIGTATVSITTLDEATESARQYADRLRKLSELVKLEREEEMRRYEQEIKNLSGREWEDRGRALFRMRGRDESRQLSGFGGHLVKFMRTNKGEPLPDHEISVGDLVMISKNDPLRDDNPTGTVTQVTNYSITASFDPKSRPLSGWVFGKGLRVDLYVSDITYQRMQDALAQLPTADGPLVHLRDVCIGTAASEEAEPTEVGAWHNPALNASQRRAVREALATEDVHLVHGPPGTGKTTTAIEILQQCVDRGESVLATAASNTAVDNVVAFLVEQGADVVRLGHPARVTPSTLTRSTPESKTMRRTSDQRNGARRRSTCSTNRTTSPTPWAAGAGA